MAAGIISRVKRRLAKWLASNSHYHFFARDMKKISDIDMAAEVLSTEYFRDQLIPIQPNLNHYSNVLIISPHQDDEAIGCGGLMTRLAEQKSRMTLLYVFNGAQPLDHMSPEEVVHTRHTEAEAMAGRVGAEILTLGIDDIAVDVTLKHVERLAEYVEYIQPDLILLPWMMDAPVKHRLANHLIYKALENIKLSQTEMWSYQVHSSLFPNVVVDITEQIDSKVDLIRLFESQVSMKRYDHYARGMAIWNSRYLYSKKNTHKDLYAECFFALPVQEWKNLTKEAYSNLDQVYKNSPKVRSKATILT